MSITPIRDWRSVEHHLGRCSTQDLAGVLASAERARDQVTAFIALVDSELRVRGGEPPRVA